MPLKQFLEIVAVSGDFDDCMVMWAVFGDCMVIRRGAAMQLGNSSLPLVQYKICSLLISNSEQACLQR